MVNPRKLRGHAWYRGPGAPRHLRIASDRWWRELQTQRRQWEADPPGGLDLSQMIDEVLDSIGEAMADMPHPFMDKTRRAEVETINGVIEQLFTVGTRPELSLNSHVGQITIRASEGNVIHVRAGGPDEELEPGDVSFSQSGDRLRISSQYGPVGIFAIDYDITVPLRCRVRVQTVEGEVRVEGTQAGVEVQTATGDVSIVDVAGDCRIKTASGDLAASDVRGHLFFRTASGDATITRSQLDGFDLENASGDVVAETALNRDGQYRFKTVGGDLRLLVPAGTGATVKLDSQGGEARSQLPAKVLRSSRRHWEGRINGGGALVRMQSLTGDLSIEESRDLAATASPSREQRGAEPAGAGSNSSSILEALARGEIGVDEAMAQLDELGA